MDPEDIEVVARPDVIDPMLRAHINSLCTALGGSHTSEGGEYLLGDEALACLKDLKRWLKGFDEKLNRLDVARSMAESNLVVGDLVEILASWPEDKTEDKYRSKIALACVELLVPLTWPLDKRPDNMTVNHHKHMPVILYAQAGYKKHILHHPSKSILRSFVRVALPSIALSPDERTERDDGIIKLVLYLLRNITMIRHPNPTEIDTGEEIEREATIEAFENSDIFHFLLAVSSGIGDEFKTQDTVVMEILYHLVKGIKIEGLFMNDKEATKNSASHLEHLLKLEKELKASNARAMSTRHSRFGTTVWVQKQDGRRVTVSGQEVVADKAMALEQLDSTKRWKRPKFRPRVNESANDFNMLAALKPTVRRCLRNFVEAFLDSGFNPLFISIRRAIEREAPRVLQIHHRQFFYLVGWFLETERMRRQSKPTTEAAAEGIDLSFSLVAGVLNQESLILLKRYMMEWFDMKQWTDLEAAMRCFVQILHTIQSMSFSPIEDDQEIAENIQNRLFYEETTLDIIVSILRRYDKQLFNYLDACTELVHVHLKMLERYSRQNAHIFVRAKRQKSRRKTKASDDPENLTINESDEDAEAEYARITRERAFNFVQYESKFFSHPCIDTFTTFLGYYKELNYHQMKKAITFFHRLFVKRELEIPLYRLDILELFYRIIQGKDAIPKTHPAYNEMDQFARHYIKHLVRKLQSTPALYVELLFSKNSRTSYILQYGKDPQPKLKQSRQPAELEIRPGLDYSEQIGVAVSVLLNEQKDMEVNWLKEALSKAAESRQAWENEHAARRMMEEVTLEDSESGTTLIRTAPVIDLNPDSDECKKAISKDSKVILLLKTLGFKSSGIEENGGDKWIIPSDLTSNDLKERLELLKEFTDEPPVYEGEKTAEDFIRRKTKPKAPRMESSDDDGAEDGEFMFPPNIMKVRDKSQKSEKKRAKRRRKRDDIEETLNDEELAEKEAELERQQEERRKRNEEKQRQIKSALYVNDSDDESDEERDRDFFEREKLMRQQVDKVITAEEVEVTKGNSGKRKRKEKGENEKVKAKKKRVKHVVSDDSGNDTASRHEEESAVHSNEDIVNTGGRIIGEGESRSEDSGAKEVEEQDDRDEDTLLRKPTFISSTLQTKSVVANRAATEHISEEDGGTEDAEDGEVRVVTGRWRRRKPAIWNSDGDEE